METAPQNPAHFMNEGVRFLSVCPLCEASYNPLEARVLEEQGSSHLLHIQCRRCLNALLALVLVSNMGISSIGLITDCTFEDVLRYKDEEAITADDVLSTHCLLEDEGAFLSVLL